MEPRKPLPDLAQAALREVATLLDSGQTFHPRYGNLQAYLTGIAGFWYVRGYDIHDWQIEAGKRGIEIFYKGNTADLYKH